MEELKRPLGPPFRPSVSAAILLAVMFSGLFVLMHKWTPGVDLTVVALVAPCAGAVLGILNGRRMAGGPRARTTGWTVLPFLVGLAVIFALPYLNLKAVTLPHFLSVALDTVVIAFFLAFPAFILTHVMTHRREMEILEKARLLGPDDGRAG
jgi:hypothetical protein